MLSPYLFSVFLLLFAASCGQQKYETFNESRFGEILAKEIFAGNTDLPILDTLKYHDEYAYLQKMILKVEQSHLLAVNRSHQWRVIIIKDNDVENIVSAPGGVLMIFTGLIQMSKTPGELLFSMAHSMLHAIEGHSFKLLSDEFGSGLLNKVSSGRNTHVVPSLVNALITVNYTWNQEVMADSGGMEVIKKLTGSAKAFSDYYLSQDEEGLDEDFPNFISTHVQNPYRKKHLKQWNSSENYTIPPQELSDFLLFKAKFR